MFSKKIHADVKKSTQKIQDPKKDTATRLKHIKIIIENADIEEARHIFKANYSHIYFVLYESFINAEATLKQRVHKAHREEVDCALATLERVFVLVPELVGKRWQCHSLTRIMHKILHPGNSWKLRRDATRLFLLWYQALGERAPESLHNMFATLVPGFPAGSSSGRPSSQPASGNADSTRNACPVTAVEIHPLLPPQGGEKQPDDPTRFFLDMLLEYIVSEVTKIEWEDKASQQPKCLSFLLERFKQYYLPHIFPKFSHSSTLYKPTLDLPELRQVSQGRVDADGKRRQDPLVPCRVALVKWVANYTHVLKKDAPPQSNSHSARSTTPGEDTDHSPDTELRRVSVSQVGSGTPAASSPPHEAHPTNNSTPLDASNRLGNRLNVENHSQQASVEDPSAVGARVVSQVLYGSRKNIDFVHEIYRQAFLLNFTHSPAIRRAIAVYKDWIQMNVAELPPFMQEPSDKEESGSTTGENNSQNHQPSITVLHSSNDPSEDNLSIRAGSQCVLQVFVTHAANVFLLEVSPDYPLLLEEQVDICKRVLNIYRYMVMHTRMESATWEQLLLVLLQITSLILSKTPPSRKEETLGGKLAPAIFQTLIVTWIKANLNVVISADLWDRFLHVLSSLNQWEELVREWAKTLETLTRVLARHVYGLDLTDLPLDRLTEQKAKKRRGGDGGGGPRWMGMGADGPGRQRRRRSSTEASSVTVPSASCYTPSTRRFEEEGPIPEDTFPDGTPLPSAMQESPRMRSGCHSFNNSVGQSEGQGEGSSPHPLRCCHHHNKAASGQLAPVRSHSEGELTLLHSTNSSSGRSRPSPSTTSGAPVLPSSVEREVARLLSYPPSSEGDCTFRAVHPSLRRSHSLDSFLRPRAGTLSRCCESEGPTRSPSPSPSSGIESNSIKDSPMQIDVIGADNTSTDLPDGSLSATSASVGGGNWSGGGTSGRHSVMGGGTVRGWLPDVAVVLWRRMLGALGDVNALRDPALHARVFEHFIELCETLIKIRLNQGVSGDNQTTPPPPELVPPISIVVPWCFEALKLPDSYRKGKLCAYRLLCSITVTPQDIPPPRDYLIEFYRVLHKGLTGDDQAVTNTLIRYCGPRFFSLALPGSSILLLDFIHAAREVTSASDVKGTPRTEACSILSGLLCFTDAMCDAPVLRPEPNQFTLTLSTGAKDLVLDALLQCGRREPTGVARCIALSGLGIFLQGQLASSSGPHPLGSYLHGPHPRVKEVTNVLLLALGFNSNMVSQVASDILLMLCDHADKLMESFPDIPPRIVEVLVVTLEDLSCSYGVVDDELRRLMTSLLFCMGEWCMHLPLACLLAPPPSLMAGPPTSLSSPMAPSLLLIIFQVLDAIVAGDMSMKRVTENEETWVKRRRRGHWPKGLFEDCEIDVFVPDLVLDNLRVGGAMSPVGTPAKKVHSMSPTTSSPDSGEGPTPSSNSDLGNRVKLAAKMVRAHLVNHVGHFPMSADGAARLPSLVVEHDDVPGLPSDELSAQVFSAPNVQLFVMSGTSQLMSLVELEALDQLRNDELLPGTSDVRVLLRGIGGKACWDVSILHCAASDSPYQGEEQREPSWCSDQEGKDISGSLDGGDMYGVGKFQGLSCRVAEESQQSLPPSSRLPMATLNGVAPPQHTLLRHRPPDTLPTWNNAAEDMDNLDDLLQYIGYTSPECLDMLDGSLNVPAPPPPQLVPGAQEDSISALLGQRHAEREHLREHLVNQRREVEGEESSPLGKGGGVHRPHPPKALSPFQHSRLLFSRLGLASWDRRPTLHLLNKGEKLLRELRNLDSQRCRETHKIAVIYVADGQEDKNSILSNTSGSQAYEEFIAGLAWEVELESHTGFLGGLQRNRSTGETAPYYATSFLEAMFHVATRMPSSSQESMLQKMRHLGNDEIHIVWSEHVRDYRRGILPTEFCDVLIVIYPLSNGLFRIHVSQKKEVPHFGPLFNEAIVDHKVLPGLVRCTALSASRAKRSMLPFYQNYYEERAKALEVVVQNHRESSTFEDFIAQVYSPVMGSSPFGHGAVRSSGAVGHSPEPGPLGGVAPNSSLLPHSTPPPPSTLAAALLDHHHHIRFGGLRSVRGSDGIKVWFGGGGGNAASSGGNADTSSSSATAGVSPRPIKRPTFKSGGAMHQRKSFSVRSESVPVTPPDSPTPRKLK
ncbi:probable Rho GTPase-activating protein CG5521 isoform X2 [Ischnura elegans]|uniref:probable Rho GTPase-activating protein CG5521 isoform X2 n=1 Tax=Ischnura elegans TaxID=197161 RepID=UPI001ED88C9C|nr:probable Rho GTPase-activating protein CG5521 isoform X2 [Ischnura elegans]